MCIRDRDMPVKVSVFLSSIIRLCLRFKALPFSCITKPSRNHLLSNYMISIVLLCVDKVTTERANAVRSYDLLTSFPEKLKSFARAFLKARRVEGQSPSWVLRATPLTCLAPLGANFVRPPKISFVSNISQ